MQVFLSILAFMYQNRDALKDVVLHIEGLIPDSPGTAKAGAVKQWIGAAMGIEAQMEAAWPLIAPIFNLFVAAAKPAKV